MTLRADNSIESELPELQLRDSKHFANLARRANARKSTGPATMEGKSVSRMNAKKHGFRSTVVTEDENEEEVGSARAKWFADLDPAGELQSKLADLAFRQMRRLDRALAAEDAALDLRVAAVRDEHRADHADFLADALVRFERDPIDGVAHLSVTADGVGLLIRTLDDYEEDADRHNWCPLRTARLLAIEGAREAGPDAVLDHTTALFDRRKSHERVILESRGLDDDPAARSSRIAAEHRLAEIADELNKYKKMLKDRIQYVRARLRLEREEAQCEEAAAIRRAVDAAKFDAADPARLLRRYVSDAQRDFLRVLREFHAARKQVLRRDPPPAPEPEPLAEPEDYPKPPEPFPTSFVPISASPARPAPNEPAPIRDGSADRKKRPRPPGELKGRNRR